MWAPGLAAEVEPCQHHEMTVRRYKSVGNTKTWSTVVGRNNRTKSKHANAAKFCDLNIFGPPLSPKYKVEKGDPLASVQYKSNRFIDGALHASTLYFGEGGIAKQIIEILFDFIVHLRSKPFDLGYLSAKKKRHT